MLVAANAEIDPLVQIALNVEIDPLAPPVDIDPMGGGGMGVDPPGAWKNWGQGGSKRLRDLLDEGIKTHINS